MGNFSGSKGLAPFLVAVLLVRGPMPAQVPGPAAAAASPESGFFSYSGGTVRGTVARTQTAPTVINKSSNYITLSGATVSWYVPKGTTDVFSVSFSVGCNLLLNSGNDFVRIQVLDNGTPMEPTDGQQAFCAYPGTYTGEWLKQASGGNHTISVQFLIVDNAPTANNMVVALTPWALKLVVYD